MAKLDPRLEYLKQNRARNITINPSPAAIADLQFFADNWHEGQPITFDALRAWMKKHHGIDAGRMGMAQYMEKAQRKPWWKK